MLMPSKNDWLRALRIYLAATTLSYLVWEILQLPLYTIWNTASPLEIASAIFHCSAGDLVISVVSIVVLMFIFGSRTWPAERFVAVMVATPVVGACYTVYSEWANTVISKTWAYSKLMPTLPIIGTGLSPLMQWLIVPSIGFAAIHHQ